MMLLIRPKQFAALESAYRSRRRTQIWAVIRANYADLCDGVSTEDALKRIDEAIEDGKALGIVADTDVVRFAVLAFLSEEVLHDPTIASVLIQILNNDEWEPVKRLDFVHKHVVARVRSANGMLDYTK